MIKTYSDLMMIPTFKERFEYLKISGTVGIDTFGYDRYLNQLLYKCDEWKNARRLAIIRDNGCDLGITGYDIMGNVYVHHMNPITVEDVLNRNPDIFNPEYLICCSLNTHNAIHYGDNDSLFPKEPIERKRNDTCPWKH